MCPLYGASVVVSGNIAIEKIIYTRPGTSLSESTIQEILYGATVTATESGTTLASTETNSAGNYQLTFSYTTNYTIAVSSQNSTSQVGALTSGTSVSSIYSDTIVSEGSSTGNVLQNHLITISNKSGAFNIFQQCERGKRFFATAGSTLSNIKCHWPATGTFFDPTTGVLSFLGVTASNSDPDEFDDDVILHEFGHFVAENISVDHSEGGQHSIVGNVDMRLAWSEGLATFISCAIRNDPVYIDSTGSKSVSGKTITSNYDNSQPASASKYSTNEVAITYVLWNAFLLDSNINNVATSLRGFRSLPASMVGEQMSLDTFRDLYTNQDLSTYYSNRTMSYAVDIVDGLTVDSAYQIDSPLTFSLSGLTFFPSNDVDYFQFTAVNGQFYSVQTSASINGSLTSLRVYKKGDVSTLISNDQITGAKTDSTSGVSFTASDTSTYIVEVSRFTSSNLGYGPYAGAYSKTVGRYGGYTLVVGNSTLPVATSVVNSSASGGGGGGCFLNH